MSFISYQDALEKILSGSTTFGTEDITLDEALNRVLAQNIYADRDYPPFNRAAMDGIAINLTDLTDYIKHFQIIETIFAGKESIITLKKGQCYKIMTGAAVPESANIIIRIEDLCIDENVAIIKDIDLIKPYQHIALKGQDLKIGNLVIAKNCVISPAIIGMLASLGCISITVYKLPIVHLITTGDEVMDIEKPVNEVQIRNSNRHVLQALLKQKGIHINLFKHLPDIENTLIKEIEKSLNCDILILCGGVSAGDADYIPKVLQELGVQKILHKVAIKPGKPIWCGYKVNGPMVFALPGNPLSCLITFKLFIEPFLNACLQQQKNEPQKTKANFNRTKKTNFDEFFPVIYENNQLSLMPTNGSGDIRLGLLANAMAWQANNEIISGEEIPYFLI